MKRDKAEALIEEVIIWKPLERHEEAIHMAVYIWYI